MSGREDQTGEQSVLGTTRPKLWIFRPPEFRGKSAACPLFLCGLMKICLRIFTLKFTAGVCWLKRSEVIRAWHPLHWGGEQFSYWQQRQPLRFRRLPFFLSTPPPIWLSYKGTKAKTRNNPALGIPQAHGCGIVTRRKGCLLYVSRIYNTHTTPASLLITLAETLPFKSRGRGGSQSLGSSPEWTGTPTAGFAQ